MKGKREEMNSKYDTGMEEDLEKTKQRFYKKLQQVKDEGLDDDFVKELGKKIIKLEDWETEVDKEYIYQLKIDSIDQNSDSSDFLYVKIVNDNKDRRKAAKKNFEESLIAIYNDEIKSLDKYLEKISQNEVHFNAENNEELSGLSLSMKKVETLKNEFLSGKYLDVDYENLVLDEEEVKLTISQVEREMEKDPDLIGLAQRWKEDKQKSQMLGDLGGIIDCKTQQEIVDFLNNKPIRVFSDRFYSELKKAKEEGTFDNSIWTDEFFQNMLEQILRKGYTRFMVSNDRYNWLMQEVFPNTSANFYLIEKLRFKNIQARGYFRILEGFRKLLYIALAARTKLYLDQKTQNEKIFDVKNGEKLKEQINSWKNDEIICKKQIKNFYVQIDHNLKHKVYAEYHKEVIDAALTYTREKGLNDDFVKKLKQNFQIISEKEKEFNKIYKEKNNAFDWMMSELSYAEEKQQSKLLDSRFSQNQKMKWNELDKDKQNVKLYMTYITNNIIDILKAAIIRQEEKGFDVSKDKEIADLLQEKEENERNLIGIINKYVDKNRDSIREQVMKTDEKNLKDDLIDLIMEFRSMIEEIDLDQPENTIIRELKENLNQFMTETNEYHQSMDGILEETWKKMSESKIYDKNLMKRVVGIAEDTEKLQTYTECVYKFANGIVDNVYMNPENSSVMLLAMENYEKEARILMEQIDQYRDSIEKESGGRKMTVDSRFPDNPNQLAKFEKATNHTVPYQKEEKDIPKAKEEPTDLGL